MAESFRPYAFVLAVPDLAASAAYFEQKLGFHTGWTDADDWRLLARGDVRFMLGHCPTTPPARDIGDHSYVAYLDMPDVDAVHREYQASGALILQLPADKPWGMREMLVGTPDGHRIMFGQQLPPKAS